jgi:hypothetical protein
MSAKNKTRPSSRWEFLVENSVSEVVGFRTSSAERSRHRGISEPGCRTWARARVAPDAYVYSSAAGSRRRGLSTARFSVGILRTFRVDHFS